MSRQEKQKLILELYNQGKTIREIAQTAHMSFGDICCLVRRETGYDDTAKQDQKFNS